MTSSSGTTAPTSGHVLRVTIDRDTVVLRGECREPVGARCRMACIVCDSDEPPPHVAFDDKDQPVGEHATGDMGECNDLLWLHDGDLDVAEMHDHTEADSVPLYDGMPIDLVWAEGSIWWRTAQLPSVDTATPQAVTA